MGFGWSQLAVLFGRALGEVAVGDPISDGHATGQMLGEVRYRHGEGSHMNDLGSMNASVFALVLVRSLWNGGD